MYFGDPIFYYCTSCGKPMKVTTYESTTIRMHDTFSDGSSSDLPYITPDLARCPYCKKPFFRHNARKTEKKTAGKIKDIETPDLPGLISALKDGLAKSPQEEKTLREDLWHEFNKKIRKGYNVLSGDELKTWQDNCAALLPLMEKSLKEMQLKKNIKKYDDNDRDNCLITVAELNRNIGNFNKCRELINQLGRSWSWLKKQYLCECKAKNPFTFELLSQRVLNLEKDPSTLEFDYLQRAEMYLATYSGRRNPKKALADLNKAEELGISDLSFHNNRGLLYLNDLNDPKSAIADFTKALSLSDGESGASIASVFNNRASAYTAIGDHAAALADKQAAVEAAKNKENDFDPAALIKDDTKHQKQKQGKSKLTEL